MDVSEKFHIYNIMKLGNQTKENVLQIRTWWLHNWEYHRQKAAVALITPYVLLTDGEFSIELLSVRRSAKYNRIQYYVSSVIHFFYQYTTKTIKS